MLEPSQVKQDIFTTLNQHALNISPFSVSGNNRIFSFCIDSDDYVIKYYSPNHTDDRNRIGHEWCFLDHLHVNGITCVPRPIAKNTDKIFAILSKIEGLPPTKETDRNHLVNVSARFINDINTNLDSALTENLPHAFEHNLNVGKTIMNIQRRFERLRQVTNTEDSQLNDIIGEAEKMLAIKAVEIEESRGTGLDLTKGLNQSELCLSPSDFGFHNLLLDDAGCPNFIDFEYAGWDDPAKLICDFILHPANHLSTSETQLFFQSLQLSMINRKRCQCMYGLFALKWVAIILNIFMPEQLERKQFSNPDLNVEAEKKFRLQTSERMLEETTLNPFGT